MDILRAWMPPLLLALTLVAHADDDARRAREGVAAGEILPLSELLDRLPLPPGGRLLEVELEHEHGRAVYEIEWLDGAGRVHEFAVDARDGRPVERRRKGSR